MLVGRKALRVGVASQAAAPGTPARPRLLRRGAAPKPPRQNRSRRKRERLEEAALTLFAERGYRATSIEDIARQAGIAVGGFYLHYRSKRQLLLSLMDQLLNRLEGLELRLPAGGDPRSGLASLLTDAFRGDLRFLGAYRAWRELVLSDPDLAQRETEIHRWTAMRVRSLFGQLQACPGARSDVDLDALSAVMDRFFWILMADANELPSIELARWVETAVDVVHHALFLDDTKGGEA